MENTTPVQADLTPQENEYEEIAWGLKSGDAKFEPIKIPRGKPGDMDVKIEMLYCGVCHSDVHWGRNELGFPVSWPFVGGHELLGKVVEVGSKVTKVKVGDHAAVGCMVDACLDCNFCKCDEEQYCCKGGMTGTYNGERMHGRVPGNQKLQTFGGYSGSQVTHERFVIKIPDNMDMAKTSPILCAGITMWDPLRHYGFTAEGAPKKCVGIIGIGGLGTMGVKLAKALGHEVVAISSSDKKETIAKEKGADIFVNMKSEESVKAANMKCDLILNTVSANHDLNVYMPLLNKRGVLVQLGAALQPHPVNQVVLMMGGTAVAGSLIGGVKSTQEVVDFCAAKNIYPDCQTIVAKDLDATWDKLVAGDADGLRFVIDIKKSLEDKSFS